MLLILSSISPFIDRLFSFKNKLREAFHFDAMHQWSVLVMTLWMVPHTAEWVATESSSRRSDARKLQWFTTPSFQDSYRLLSQNATEKPATGALSVRQLGAHRGWPFNSVVMEDHNILVASSDVAAYYPLDNMFDNWCYIFRSHHTDQH